MSDHDANPNASAGLEPPARETTPQKRRLIIRMAELVARHRLEAGLRDRETASSDIQALIHRVRNLGAELRKIETGKEDQ